MASEHGDADTQRQIDERALAAVVPDVVGPADHPIFSERFPPDGPRGPEVTAPGVGATSTYSWIDVCLLLAIPTDEPLF